MTGYLGRNEILNTTNNEFNNAAIFPVWHVLPMLHHDQINVTAGNLKIALSEKITLLLDRHVDVPCSLVVT